VELALLGPHFGDIHMEESALVEAERLLSTASVGNDRLRPRFCSRMRNSALSYALSPISYFDDLFLRISRSAA
jgi:hypothetical protein